MRSPRATDLATPVDLRDGRHATDDRLVSALHPSYADALARLPAGRQVFRGIPFDFASASDERRWLLLDRDVSVDLGRVEASHVVIAHFCDTWRDAVTGRPADLPVGWVTPVGQELARYTVDLVAGGSVERTIRRRFEVNDGIVGWGQGAFASVPHPVEKPLDWRGPHPVPPPGGYAAPGEAGLLGILPGSWGPGQTGVADAVPSPTGDIAYSLYVLEVPPGERLERLRLEPLASLADGSGIVVGAVTTFRGTASPLALSPRRTLRVDPARSVDIDLGQIFRVRAAVAQTWPAADDPVGWGTPRVDGGGEAVEVDLSIAGDATLAIDGTVVPITGLPGEGSDARSDSVRIEVLPTPTARVEIEIRDRATGQRTPARIRFVAPDGRYLPPLGHRDEVNPGLNEDTGADALLGGSTYAYVPGRFPILLPPGTVDVEVVHGFAHRPVRRSIDAVAAGRAPIVVELDPIDASDWTAVDSH
ncbi:MAG TPA: hypothetical protein VF253_10795, partial [Candidatus Limnocylindrales bacterium]